MFIKGDKSIIKGILVVLGFNFDELQRGLGTLDIEGEVAIPPYFIPMNELDYEGWIMMIGILK